MKRITTIGQDGNEGIVRELKRVGLTLGVNGGVIGYTTRDGIKLSRDTISILEEVEMDEVYEVILKEIILDTLRKHRDVYGIGVTSTALLISGMLEELGKGNDLNLNKEDYYKAFRDHKMAYDKSMLNTLIKTSCKGDKKLEDGIEFGFRSGEDLPINLWVKNLDSLQREEVSYSSVGYRFGANIVSDTRDSRYKIENCILAIKDVLSEDDLYGYKKEEVGVIVCTYMTDDAVRAIEETGVSKNIVIYEIGGRNSGIELDLPVYLENDKIGDGLYRVGTVVVDGDECIVKSNKAVDVGGKIEEMMRSISTIDDVKDRKNMVRRISRLRGVYYDVYLTPIENMHDQVYVSDIVDSINIGVCNGVSVGTGITLHRVGEAMNNRFDSISYAWCSAVLNANIENAMAVTDVIVDIGSSELVDGLDAYDTLLSIVSSAIDAINIIKDCKAVIS